MKKAFKIILAILITILIFASAAYMFGVYYFRDWYGPNTYINGQNVSFEDVAVTPDILLSYVEFDDFEITDSKGETIHIEGTDIYEFDETEIARVTSEILKKENPFYWPWQLFNNTEYIYEPTLTLNEERLNEIIEESYLGGLNRYRSGLCPYITYSDEDGYVLVDDTRNLVDWELATSVITEAARNRNKSINLDDYDIYRSSKVTQKFGDVYKEWNDLQKVIDFEMTYKLCTGEDVVIDSAVMSSFVVKDEENKPIYDESGKFTIDYVKVHDFVQKMSDDYDNMYTDKKFKTTRGDVVTIPYSRYTTYGSLIDVEKEYSELCGILETMKSPGEREPIYRFKEDHGSYADNYGGTYVDIDLTGQHMYYYVDNELVFDTDVVTGCQSNGNSTPECVCYIVNKARRIVLIGPGYESFVYYWMCITSQIGIHDATWRSTFGGEIYKWNGSHGCINTPLDKMGELFDMMEIGTPVIVHK